MIDIARRIPAGCAINGPAGVDLEEIARIENIGRFGTNLPAAVADDELPFSDRHAREQPEPSS
jgi:hypothetical protein